MKEYFCLTVFQRRRQIVELQKAVDQFGGHSGLAKALTRATKGRRVPSYTVTSFFHTRFPSKWTLPLMDVTKDLSIHNLDPLNYPKNMVKYLD